MNNKITFSIMMKLVIAVLVLVWMLAPLANVHAGTLSSSSSYEDIDQYIEEQLNTMNIPAASLVIVEGDEIVHTRGFGAVGAGGAVPTPQTPFFIGSVTKSFTALAVMQLVEDGRVELDAPVQRYLPWFTLADPQAAARITVRQLLIQTSGISQIPGMKGLANFDNTPGAAERQVRALADVEPARPAGSEWEYSNVNFNLLGLIIEAVSGETYADYVQNHIFTPLEMNHAYSSKDDARQDGLPGGHQMWFGFPIAVPDLPVPAGSLASGQLIASAEDMGHYLIAQLNDGEYGSVRVLSAEGMAEMHRAATDISMTGGEDMGDYGMGWFVKETQQGSLVYHHGEVPDYFSYMALLPEHDRAVMLLYNANHQVYNYALLDMSETVALSLAGAEPGPDNRGVIPWALRAALLLPVLQIFLIVVTLRRVKGWRENTLTRPGDNRMWWLHILLPGLLNLVLAGIGVALLASGLFKFMMLFMGDIISLLMLSGVIALVWLVVRTSMMLRVMKTPAV